jgi:hypothetical protein
MGADTPEQLADRLRAATASARADALLGARVIAAARARAALERPAAFVIAFSASVVVWLAVYGAGASSADASDDGVTFEAAFDPTGEPL